MQDTSGLYQPLPGLYWHIAGASLWAWLKTKGQSTGYQVIGHVWHAHCFHRVTHLCEVWHLLKDVSQFTHRCLVNRGQLFLWLKSCFVGILTEVLMEFPTMPPSKQNLRTSPPFVCFSANHSFWLPAGNIAWVSEVVFYHSLQQSLSFPGWCPTNASIRWESQTSKWRRALTCFNFSFLAWPAVKQAGCQEK